MIWYGIQVTIIGLLVVFVGLGLLIGCIVVMTRFTGNMRKSEENKPEASLPDLQEPAVEDAELEEMALVDQLELMAVITATLSAILESENAEPVEEPMAGFVVRSVRRTQNAPAWNRAGRGMQILSRL